MGLDNILRACADLTNGRDADYLPAMEIILADQAAARDELVKLREVEVQSRRLWMSLRSASVCLVEGFGDEYSNAHDSLTLALAAIKPLDPPEGL